jgi:hypothetical protein
MRTITEYHYKEPVVFDYARIEELVIRYGYAPATLKQSCDGCGYSDDTMLHTIKSGSEYFNTHSIERMEMPDVTFGYSYKDICGLLKPQDVYGFAFCLALYNSQSAGDEALEKVLCGTLNEHVPIEYSALLRDTNGWLFWEYQFINILRLFTSDRDEPSRILKDYKKYKGSKPVLCSEWKLNGIPIQESMEKNMLQKGGIYRLLLKPALAAYTWCML